MLTRARMKSALEKDTAVDAADVIAALEDFIPPSYPTEIELQNLVAVLECTSRSLLPEGVPAGRSGRDHPPRTRAVAAGAGLMGAPLRTSFPKDQIRVLLLEKVAPSAVEAFGAEGFQVEAARLPP